MAKKHPQIYILMATFLWSLGGVLIKLVPWNPLVIIGIRSFLAFFVLYMYREKNKKVVLNSSIILGGLCISLTSIIFVFSNKLTTAANAIVLQYTAPIFVLVLSFLFLRKVPKKNEIFTVLVAFLGIIIFFFDEMTPGQMLGNVLAIFSGLSFAGVFFANRIKNSDPLDAAILANIINVIICTPFIINANEAPLPLQGVLALMVLGVLQIGLSYVFFSEGIKYSSSVSASLLCMIEALLNPIWVSLFIGEIPSVYALIGGSIVIFAVGYNIISEARENKSSENFPAKA